MEGIQIPNFVNERHYAIQRENEYLKKENKKEIMWWDE